MRLRMAEVRAKNYKVRAKNYKEFKSGPCFFCNEPVRPRYLLTPLELGVER